MVVVVEVMRGVMEYAHNVKYELEKKNKKRKCRFGLFSSLFSFLFLFSCQRESFDNKIKEWNGERKKE